MIPSKLEVVLPHTTTEATVMLWKVHACTSNAAVIIQCAIQDFQQLYLVISSQEPGLPSVIHEQVCATDVE